MIQGASAPKTGNISVPSVDLSSATSSGKKLVTSGDITDFVDGIPVGDKMVVRIQKEFEITYVSYTGSSGSCTLITTLIESGTYVAERPGYDTPSAIRLGVQICTEYGSASNLKLSRIDVNTDGSVSVTSFGKTNAPIIHTRRFEDGTSAGEYYWLCA